MSFVEFIQRLPGLDDLKIGERFLLSILVWHCGSNGHCWPTVDQLTKEMGSNRKTTFNLLRSLEIKGYLIRTKRSKNQNLYALCLRGAKKGTTKNCTSAKKGSSVLATERCKKGDYLLKKKEKKEKKEHVPKISRPSENSRIYNAYVSGRQAVLSDPEWKPLAPLAKAMRKNIKTWLEDDKLTSDDLLLCLSHYLEDQDWPRKTRWAWEAFAKDPTRWRRLQQEPSDNSWDTEYLNG